MISKLLQENGDYLLQENADYILLNLWYPISTTYNLEIRDTSGNLLAILENAHDINYVARLMAPHILRFSLPADDSKTAFLVVTNEVWLRNAKTDSIVRKFRILNRGDIRD